MVSIVIPNYNGERYLRACIESVYAQNYKEMELIIIDNASADSKYTWLSEYPEAVFKRLDKNYGFSKAVNEGIGLAKGEYVILLNNDTVLEKGFVQALVDAISQDDRTFSVCSKMISYQDRNLIDDAGDEYNLLGWTLKCGDGKSVEYYTKSREVFSSCAGAAIYRKAVFEEIGYFEENFFAYMEDVDISYRARIYGYKNRYCPEAKVYHIGSATSGSRYNAFKVKLAARNNIYVPYKNMPALQLVLNSPFLLVGFLVKYLFFIKKGFDKEYAEGIKEGIRSLGRIEKIKFRIKHVPSYLKIEWQLVYNTCHYMVYALRGLR